MQIALIGYGKMGKTIESLAAAAGHDVVARINSADSGDWKAAKSADVAIEFTNPNAVVPNLERCLEIGLPVVTGSTGWYDQLPAVSKHFIEETGALLYASNFSIGVNLVMEINRKLATLMNTLPEYKVTMNETHHTQKLDAPSGTAITLANEMIERLDRKTKWINEASDENEILPIVSFREADVPGTHTVTYTSDCDEIQLTHRAFNRSGFARGALLAAEWLVGKHGIFTLQDVLHLNTTK